MHTTLTNHAVDETAEHTRVTVSFPEPPPDAVASGGRIITARTAHFHYDRRAGKTWKLISVGVEGRRRDEHGVTHYARGDWDSRLLDPDGDPVSWGDGWTLTRVPRWLRDLADHHLPTT